MRNYGVPGRPTPKMEEHICACGAKHKTFKALQNHIRKQRFRENAGWELKGSHKPSHYTKNGTSFQY